MGIIMLLTGMLTGLSAGLAPGPLMAIIVSESLERGWKQGVKLALVPLITDAPIVAAAIWLGTRAADTAFVMTGLSLIGGLYLIWLAMGEFRGGPEQSGNQSRGDSFFFRGILVNLLSPHPYGFWIFVGVPMMVRGGGLYAKPAWLFVAGFYSCLVGVKMVIAVALGTLRGRVSLKGVLYLRRAMAILILIFGVWLLGDGVLRLGGFVR